MTIAAVLKYSADYQIKHAKWLADQVPGIVFISDIEIPGVITVPMKHKWPGWWSKINLFSDAIPGDILYLDIDTVVLDKDFLGVIKIAANRKTTMLSDFYFPKRAASGIMYIAEQDKNKVWQTFVNNPRQYMRKFRTLGDGGFINSVLPDVRRWDKVFPGSIISYKKDVLRPGDKYSDKFTCGTGKVPADAKIIAFHGRPRPWQANESWIPKLIT